MQQIELLEFEQHSYEKRYMLSCVFKGRNKFLLRYNSTANDFFSALGYMGSFRREAFRN